MHVLSLVDDTHPAAKPLHDAVVRDGVADHRRESYACERGKSMKPDWGLKSVVGEKSPVHSVVGIVTGRLYTWRTSPSRATISYNTGLTKNPMKRREMRPATMTMANGL